ncbi:MAG: CHASE2 domain-containing protein [Rubrivivax sp.]|nr:CHASE2 domain-containing protein [Rubrivivax sp.]
MSPPPPRGAAPPALQRDTWWLAALLAVLAALLAATQATWRLDRIVYDQALAWSSLPVPADITVIAIDDASLAAIGRWPWPRAVHTTLLEQLVPLQPRAVLLDLVLSEADADPRQDALLASALQRLGRGVLPVPWVSLPGAAPQWLLPVPGLAAAARLGVAEPVPDADGVLRHTFLQVGPAASPLPHVALQMLQAAGEPVHAGLRLPSLPAVQTAAGAATEAAGWQRHGRLPIRFSGPPGHVDRVSYVDVLRGAVPAARLQGRHLLVGMTAQGLGDTVATPVSALQGTMPGVEVLAQTLHMLRSGDGLRAPAPAVVAALSALAVLAGVLVMARLGPRRALPATLLAAAAVLLASAVAVAAGVWWPPMPTVAAALLAYPLWSWRRLEHAVAGLDRQILRLHRSLPAAAQGTPGVAGPGADAIDARLQRLQSAGDLLHQARRYLADVLDSLPTAMIVADGKQRVVMANAQAAAIFEAGHADELLGLDLPRLLQEFRSDDTPDWPALLARLQPGDPAQARELHLEGQGDYVLRLSAAELAGSRRLLLSIADVEPVKQAQRQREEALAFVSHDLRSPASAILLLTDPATASAGGPGAWLPQVRRLARRSLDLSDAFVRYAQADLLAPQCAPVPVQALVDDALAELAPRAHALGLRLDVQLQPPQAVLVLDRALVARALANLVANALRHSPAGGCVRLSCHVDAAGPCFEVADQGPGLNAAQQQQIHGAEEGLRSGDGQGLGLGLRFVQRVARRHGGRLRWLPAARPAPPGAADTAGGHFELRLPAPDSGNP